MFKYAYLLTALLITLSLKCGSIGYDISMYEGNGCIKKFGYSPYSYGFEIDFGRFLLSDTIKQVYHINKLPPHASHHFVTLRFFNISKINQNIINKIKPILRVWTSEKEFFKCSIPLGEYSNHKDLLEDDTSVTFYYIDSNVLKTGPRLPSSDFLQDSISNERLFLSVEFESIPSEILNNNIYVSLLVTAGGR